MPSKPNLCSYIHHQPFACFEIYIPVCVVQIANSEITRVKYSNRCYAYKDVSVYAFIDGICDSQPTNASSYLTKLLKPYQQYLCLAVYQLVFGSYKRHILCILLL